MKKLILSAALLISGTVAQAMESSDIAAEKPAVAAETSLTQEAVAVAEPRVETKLVVEAKPVAAEEKVEIKAEPVQVTAPESSLFTSLFVGFPDSLKAAFTDSANYIASHPKTTAALSSATSLVLLTTAWKLRKKNPVVATLCALSSAATAGYAGYVVYKNGLIKSACNRLFPVKAAATVTPAATKVSVPGTVVIDRLLEHTVEGTYGPITVPATTVSIAIPVTTSSVTAPVPMPAA